MIAEEKYILLVEDNPDDVDLTIMALEKSDIRIAVKVAKDGEEALNLLHGSGTVKSDHDKGLPSVILLDLNMPKINGLDVLKEIRNNDRTKQLPVVILTSSREEQDISQGYDLGANSYIQKPVDFENFVTAIKQLGQYWLDLNEPPV